MTAVLDDILARFRSLPSGEKQAVVQAAAQVTRGMKFLPNPGPQTEAFFSEADVLLYGGSGGGGKSHLLLGLAFEQHRRSLIMRREYTDLGALTETAIKINGTRSGFNGSAPPKLRTTDGRLIEFGAAKNVGDEEGWQGQPHDLLGFDEAVQFLESQVRFLLGWVRTDVEGQRCRTLLCSNPPTKVEGVWVIGMFRPWLDPTHHNPARPGELRWYVTDPDGKDMEVDGPAPVQFPGRDHPVLPKSRTFIAASLGDNPFLVRTGYQSTLDALPEPLRSAIRDGNFMAARRDATNQLIPTDWVRAAQERWTANPPASVPMCAMGVDVAAGGEDETVIACRYDGWYAPLVVVPGSKTPFGKDVAGLILSHRRGGAAVVVDMGGGYGGAVYEHLKTNDIPVHGFKGAAASVRRTKDRQLKFSNKRSEAWWRFREALDPSQEGGSLIALPDDPQLISDLTAPTFEADLAKGIKVEPKEKIVERLGRSTDRGDAVVMAWSEGNKLVNMIGGYWPEGMRADQRPISFSRGPQVITQRPKH